MSSARIQNPKTQQLRPKQDKIKAANPCAWEYPKATAAQRKPNTTNAGRETTIVTIIEANSTPLITVQEFRNLFRSAVEGRSTGGSTGAWGLDGVILILPKMHLSRKPKGLRRKRPQLLCNSHPPR
jgi:hypothetical protein